VSRHTRHAQPDAKSEREAADLHPLPGQIKAVPVAQHFRPLADPTLDPAGCDMPERGVAAEHDDRQQCKSPQAEAQRTAHARRYSGPSPAPPAPAAP
jgi:hypothetical protein